MAVETIDEAGKYFSLVDSVAYIESGGDLVVKTDITELVELAEDDEPEKDKTDCLHHFLEEYGELTKVKSFRLVL